MHICLDCPAELVRTGAQRWPKRCPDCQKKRRNAQGLERHHRIAKNDPILVERARRRAATWMAENPERYREQRAEYAATHVEENRARAREWYGQNPDRVARQASRQPEARAEVNRVFGRRNYLKYKYGLTVERVTAIFEAQGGRCAICRGRMELKPPGGDRHDRRSWLNGPVIDHDHETGQHRELLCHRCNSAIGLLQDDPEIIRRAAEYVLKHRQMLLPI